MAKCSACGGTGKAKPKESNPNMPRKPESERHERSIGARKPGKEQNKLEKSNERMRAKKDAKMEQNKKKKYGY